ncbi:hypothetical protein PtB15_10B96 [Puccinia triticina]|nr:hypothetical protein PtB15_10B96 [Puccinia triticina]
MFASLSDLLGSGKAFITSSGEMMENNAIGKASQELPPHNANEAGKGNPPNNWGEDGGGLYLGEGFS